MKFILNFFRVLFSLVLMLVLTASLLVTSIIRPVMQTINGTDNGKMVETIVEGMVDEIINNENSEGAQAIYSALEEKTGLNAEQVKTILQNEEIRTLTEDMLNAAISNTIGTGNVAYPSKDAVSDVVYNNIDVLGAAFGVNDVSSIDKDTIVNLVEENYDSILGMLQNLVTSSDNGSEVIE